MFHRLVIENVQSNRNILESHRCSEMKKKVWMNQAREVEKKIQTVLNQFTAQNE